LFVGEPKINGQITHVTVAVRRTGDPSKSSRVRIYTVDGTAEAGRDYQPITKVTPACTDHNEALVLGGGRGRWRGVDVIKQ
jgi:hypothetical protein